MGAVVRGFVKNNLASLLLILLVTAGLFLPVCGYNFINWDDDRMVYENAAIRGFSLEHLIHWFSVPAVKLYIPVTLASFAGDYVVWGLNPGGFHLTNLLLHLLNVFWVWRILGLCFKSRTAVAAGTLLFAIHPVQAQAVAWVSERKTLLSTFFILTALYGTMANKIRLVSWKFISLYVLSILSRPTGILLPFLAGIARIKGSMDSRILRLSGRAPR